MKTTIIGLDQILIAFFEKIAHKFQDWTGKNNFWLVRATVFVYIAITLMNFEKDQSLHIAFVMVMIISFMFLRISFKAESLVSKNGKFKNVLSQPNLFVAVVRIGYVGLLIVRPAVEYVKDFNLSASEISSISGNCAFMCILYFICSTPKPPSDSKIKKLLQSLFGSRKMVSVSS